MFQKGIGLALMAVIFSGLVLAQEGESPNTLGAQYDKMIRVSYSYKGYLSIKQETIADFYKQAMDSVYAERTEVMALNEGIREDRLKTAECQKNLAEIKTALTESNALNDRIQFFGMSMTKVAYNSSALIVILTLLIFGVAAFVRYRSSSRNTTVAQNELSVLIDEHEELKKKARDREVELKRELQTALNRLEELEG